LVHLKRKRILAPLSRVRATDADPFRVIFFLGLAESWKAGQKGKEFCLTKNVATKAEPATKFKSPSTWKYIFKWRLEGDTVT